MRVLVVGAGVIGLSCAVRLREAGYDAHVLGRDLPPETTSAVAAALWYPYLALPRDRVMTWSRTTYVELERIAREHPAAGVCLRWGTELVRTPAGITPWWRNAVPQPDRLQVLDDPPPGAGGGWRALVPVADTSVYLPWLARRLDALGGTVTRAWLPALPERGIVINCAGLGARALAADAGLTPVRGQVVYVRQVGLSEWWLDQDDGHDLTYVVPREADIVVGGTAEEGSDDGRPDPTTTERILARATRLVPALRDAPVVGVRVGLRPGRRSVRLETVRHADGATVHCYGHAGAGVTVSWGCAADVVAEVERLHRLDREDAVQPHDDEQPVEAGGHVTQDEATSYPSGTTVRAEE